MTLRSEWALKLIVKSSISVSASLFIFFLRHRDRAIEFGPFLGRLSLSAFSPVHGPPQGLADHEGDLDDALEKAKNRRHQKMPSFIEFWRRMGYPFEMKTCSIEGCSKAVEKRGWCGMHYRRFLRYGDTSTTRKRPNGSYVHWIKENANFSGDECLPWPFYRKATGYAGIVRLNGKGIVAPRLMCILAHGDPPTARHQAAHECGKGHEGCVNPAHLSWKLPVDNHADMARHGTMIVGEASVNAKLTTDIVCSIREAGRQGAMHRDLAARYKVSESLITSIINRRRWAWLD
jgi:hypothetical protein